MKTFLLTTFLSASLAAGVFGQAAKPAPAPYSADFQKAAVGELPDGMMEIDGVFVVAEGAEPDKDAKYLEMAAEPLTENAVIFGASMKSGATIEAKIRGFRKRRSYPRFGIGLHGISGYRLRVVPSKKVIELVKNEEPVKSVPFEWKADEWQRLELSIIAKGDKWSVEGRAWSDGAEKPKEATIQLEHEGKPGQGKASVWGTAYSGKVLQFDDIAVKPAS